MISTDQPNDHSTLIAALIAELQRQGIRDERVLAALAHVPRTSFVPDVLPEQAWANIALPIGVNQTISQPYIVALMTSALQLQGTERVLEIGTGSGYQAAILAELAAQVYSIERHPDLSNRAKTLLDELGYDNVETVIGDGTIGWPEHAPFDRIIVTAGAPKVPSLLLEQLSGERGRLVIPVGEADDQVLLLVERQGDQIHEQPLGPVRFVPLIGEQGWNTGATQR